MQVLVLPPFDREFFGGSDRLELEAGDLLGLVRQLGERAPAFAEVAEMRATFAIDGVVAPDWSVPLAGVREVILLPRIGGG